MTAPICARHPAEAAERRCERCGDNLCPTCEAFGCEAMGCPYRASADGADSWAVPVPWEARLELGGARAAWHTFRRVVWDPLRFFRDLPEGPGSGALRFGVIVGSLALIPGVVTLGVSRPALAPLAAPVVLAVPFALHLRMLSTAASVWLLLVLTADRDDWPAVERVAGYAAAADALLVVPALGWVVGPLVSGVYRAVGLRVALGVPRWTALVAGMGPTLLVGLAALGAVGLAVISGLLPL
jgi:hypothetical protein